MAETEVMEIDCGDAMGIADVGDMYAKLLAVLADGHQVKLDISKLERVDAAALQMIYALAKEMAAHGATLSWNSPSEAFIRGVKLLGLAQLINIDDNNEQANA
jgi:anti-anti-sigma regulatory factor